jgi:hypothetical protein
MRFKLSNSWNSRNFFLIGFNFQVLTNLTRTSVRFCSALNATAPKPHVNCHQPTMTPPSHRDDENVLMAAVMAAI